MSLRQCIIVAGLALLFADPTTAHVTLESSQAAPNFRCLASEDWC
jgi:hypothetical protein